MYKHSIMRINYTMYNVRRNEDVIHSDTTHCNVMVLDPTTFSEHSFWYACILGIFHANVIYTAEGVDDFHPQWLEFLWVRWYEVEDTLSGWMARSLDRIKF